MELCQEAPFYTLGPTHGAASSPRPDCHSAAAQQWVAIAKAHMQLPIVGQAPAWWRTRAREIVGRVVLAALAVTMWINVAGNALDILQA